MPRRPAGERALTPAERNARHRAARARRVESWKQALQRIEALPSDLPIQEARRIATLALADKPGEPPL
jgi:hypothetical protein